MSISIGRRSPCLALLPGAVVGHLATSLQPLRPRLAHILHHQPADGLLSRVPLRSSAHSLPSKGSTSHLSNYTSVVLRSSVPISALIIDITAASTLVSIADTDELDLPGCILFATSATMLALCSYFPTYTAARNTDPIDIDVPGLRMVPEALVLPSLHNLNHFFTVQFIEKGQMLPKSAGILLNAFQGLRSRSRKWAPGSRGAGGGSCG